MFTANRADKFASVIDQCGLLDLGATGSLFTWYKNSVGFQPVSKRLDRALADCHWRNLFPEAFVENLNRLSSDHRPILLRCKGFVPDRKAHPFRFQAAWLTHKDFPPVVHKAWERGDHVVLQSLDKVKEDATEFNTKVFGNIFRKKKSLEHKLKDVQRRLE